MALQRRPSLPCLTGARFVAALLVVLFHFGPLPGWPALLFLWGRQAVSFFVSFQQASLTSHTESATPHITQTPQSTRNPSQALLIACLYRRSLPFVRCVSRTPQEDTC